jgi:hypothetical protein
MPSELCHPERSRGTPDLSRRQPTHPNHGSTAVYDARSSVRPYVIQRAAKNPGSDARNGGHSLKSGRKQSFPVEVFTKMFHVKRRLVQGNKNTNSDRYNLPASFAVAGRSSFALFLLVSIGTFSFSL